MEVQKELSSKTGLELPATFVFDYPSIAEMQGFIIKALPQQTAGNDVVVPTEVKRGKIGAAFHPLESQCFSV